MAIRGFASDVVENWLQGVITATLPDQVPDGAVTAARNTQFYNVGPQQAVLGTRKGCEIQNATILPSPASSQFFYKTPITSKHLLVLQNGTIGELASGTYAQIEASIVTAPNDFISWQTFDGFAFLANGTDLLKTDGSDAWAWGMPYPDDADWSVAATSSGGVLPADDYDVAIGFVNTTTGYVGPTSAIKTVTIGAGDKLTVTFPNAGDIGDAQVDYIRVYLRPQSISTELFYAATGGTPAETGTDGWAVGTTDVEFDLTSAQLVALTVLAPNPNENYGPPTDTKFVIAHKNRMFALTDNELFWSEVDQPEGFNWVLNAITVGEDDGNISTGMAVHDQQLIIFKKNSIYILSGDDPQSWEISLLDPTVGCISASSITYNDNRLFWMSLRGPYMWAIGGSSIDITTQLVKDQFDETRINPDDLENSIGFAHPVDNYVAWAIIPVGETRRITIVPFHSKLERWMATEWNVVDVLSATTVQDSTGRAYPMIADYEGFIYKMGVTGSDGVDSGTETTGTVTSATTTSLTDSTQTFTPNELVGRYIYAYDEDAGVMTAQRRRITSNGNTTIQISEGWDTTPTVGYLYSIGGILVDWRTGFRTGGGPFYKKRIEFGFLQLGVSDAGTECEVSFYKDGDEDTALTRRTITLGTPALFDEAYFDIDNFSQAVAQEFRIPIRSVGYSWQTRVSQMSSGEQIYIQRLGIQWLTKTKHTSRSL